MSEDATLSEVLTIATRVFQKTEGLVDYNTAFNFGTRNDVDSFNAAGGKTGDLGYYPIPNANGDIVYVPCLDRVTALFDGDAVRDIIGQEAQYVDPSRKPFLATGDGGANDRAALAAADLAAQLAGLPMLIARRHKVGSDITLASRLFFVGGGRLEPIASATVICRNEVSAPRHRIFAGAGKVVGIRQVYPEWWGAVIGDVTVNSSSAFMDAAACLKASKASAGGRQAIDMGGGGAYWFATPVVIEADENCNPYLTGAGTILGGTRLRDATGFPADGRPVLQVRGSNLAGTSVSDWGLRDFGIEKGTGGAIRGLQIGDEAEDSMLVGQSWQKLDNILVEGFVKNARILHARQVTLNSFSSWAEHVVGAVEPLVIEIDGGHTNDIVVNDNCQFVSNAHTNENSVGIVIRATTGAYNPETAKNSIGGIKLGNCDIYKAQRAFVVYAANGSYISEIELAQPQFDNFCVNPIYVESEDNGAVKPVIEHFRIQNTTMFSALGDAVVLTSTGGGGIIRSWSLVNATIMGPQQKVIGIYGLGVKAGLVAGNMIRNANFHNGVTIGGIYQNGTGVVFDFGDCEGITAYGNRLHRTDGAAFPDYFARFGPNATGIQWFGNDSGSLCALGLVRDESTTANKTITHDPGDPLGPIVSTPLAGAVASTTIVGPFKPDLGRPIKLRLTESWDATVRVLRSSSLAETKAPLTVAGMDWGLFTQNCDQVVWEEEEVGALMWLSFDPHPLSSEIHYRMYQE